MHHHQRPHPNPETSRPDRPHEPAASATAVERGDTSEYQRRLALFHAHATALLNGDIVDAARLSDTIDRRHRLSHHVFVLAVALTAVTDHFGHDLDPAALDLLIERLRRSTPNVSPLKTEALIRACYDEPHLIAELAHTEQLASGWALIRLTIGPDHATADLDDLVARAEHTGRHTVRAIYAQAPSWHWYTADDARCAAHG